MLTREQMEQFDNALRQYLIAMKKAQGFTDERLGRRAFGYLESPRGKIQALFVGQGAAGARKPQVINICELLNLCEAMKLSWSGCIRDALKAIDR